MAGNKAKAAIGKSQLATGQRKTKQSALSSQHSATAKTKSKTETNPKTSKAKPRKARGKGRRHVHSGDDYFKVTTFPSVKGKVVREVRFSHDDPNNVLAIAFKDRTVLYFDINPEALILPLEVNAHYIGESRRGHKTWEGLAGAQA